jgi:hypothetical protein
MRRVNMKRYLEPDLISALKFWDVDGKTMRKYHYDREEVDFDEVYSDIVRNRTQMGYYSY